jgi:hypothetical protein
LAEPLGISKTLLTALVVLPTIAAVWMIVRAIRRSVEK